MPSSRIVDLALGLAFIFGVTAALSSVLTELIARFLGLRGTYLLQGLRELLDGEAAAVTDLTQAERDYRRAVDVVAGRAPGGSPGEGTPSSGTAEGSPSSGTAEGSLTATGVLLGSPMLAGHAMTGRITARALTVNTDQGRPAAVSPLTSDRLRRQRRSLPAYISARSFADAVLDLLVPDAAGQTSLTVVRSSIDALPDELAPFKASLVALTKTAGDDVAAFRTSVEHWYDDHMSSVSGWYKRRVAKITIVVGAVLVVLLNVNAVTIGRTLYTDNDVRAAVSTFATQTDTCRAATSPGVDCLRDLGRRLSDAEGSGLPLGWATVRDCTPRNSGCNWWDERGILDHNGGSFWRLLLILLGFALTITSLVPGARFWFDLLGRLGSLRTSGPRPPSSTT